MSHPFTTIWSEKWPVYRILPDCSQFEGSSRHWGEIAAEGFSAFIENQKELSIQEIKQYGTKWGELVEDKSLLRAVINNQVLGVEESFYDFLIWKKLTKKAHKAGKANRKYIGSLLNKHWRLVVCKKNPILYRQGWY